MYKPDLNREPYVIESRKSDFIDLSSLANSLYSNPRNYAGPVGCGKSTVLSMLRCYYNMRYDAKELFQRTEKNRFRDGMNRYLVISADFSDFQAENRKEMLAWLREKMSLLYASFWDFLPESSETCLDILACESDERTLEYSLKELVSQLRHCSIRLPEHLARRQKERPILLLDEPGRVEIVASHFGYWYEISHFCENFLDVDWYEMTAGMFITCYAPVEGDVCYSLYLGNPSVESTAQESRPRSMTG